MTIYLSDDCEYKHLDGSNVLVITLQEAKDLQAYFLKAGYISYEFDMPIHDFYKKLNVFIGRNDFVADISS